MALTTGKALPLQGVYKLTLFSSDAPLSLVLAALQSVPVLTGTEEHGFNFTLYTGDLVSHDPEQELSR